ncbi:Type-1 restriction enzyme MjaXIP specificity protein [ANME-1 cluster archaeon GoMg3.2]|nr:Type-1 restriction enzyme MjaXIP specificity protein [ANME-1 cluster archaeon GoMg3.2]
MKTETTLSNHKKLKIRIYFPVAPKQSLSQLKGFATGTTSVAAIYTRDLLKLEVPLPPFPEQQAIAKILSDMDTEIESLEQKRDKYKVIKQGMMQELLTGKRRFA